MAIQIRFLPDDITVEAEPGESILEVANRANIFIPTGCLMGSCHACEVEIDDDMTVCACITAVPMGRKHLTIHLYSDSAW